MNRRQNQSALAAALQVSLSIILVSISAILLATSFIAAPRQIGEAGPTPALASETVALPVTSIDVSLPISTVVLQSVTTTNIAAAETYLGFQGDFTFDSTVINFADPVVVGGGLTGSGWNVSGNVLNSGPGTMKTLRVSAFVQDGQTPLSGEGTLFNLRMVRISNNVGASTSLNWKPDPDNFIFIDQNLAPLVPAQTNGAITIGGMTPTPTPASSATPPFEGGTLLWEGFDTANPPALPSGWQTSFTPGAADCTPTGTCSLGTNWVTTTVNPYSGSLSAFHDAPACVTDSVLDTRQFSVPFINTIDTLAVSFRQSYNLENGRDGGVLEISIDGGPFTDIVAAGGSINYSGTISTGFLSPIGGRQAFTGTSGGYIWTFAGLPHSAIGRNVVLRFRLATDCSGSGMGWFIDEVFAFYHFNGTPFPSPTPTPPLSPTPTPTPTDSPTPTVSPTPTPTPICGFYLQGFDDITTLIPSGWFMKNNTEPGPGSTGWFQGNTTVFPSHTGAPDSYISADFNNGTGTSTISNWLLTPPLSLQNGAVLSFWSRTVDTPSFPDRLQVRMSTNGASTDVGATATSVGDFTTVLLDINPTYVLDGYPSVWTQFTVTLSGMASPTTGRLALRYFVENGGPSGANSDFIGIDTLTVQLQCATPTPTPRPTATPMPPTPTPLKGLITLVSRLSDAQAGASNAASNDAPPPQVQTDFAPAHLGNSASISGESGAGTGNSTSNSSIILDNAIGSLRVTGDGTASANAMFIHASAGASAKLISLTFTLSDFSYAYSLSGQISGMSNGGTWAATAKLVQGSAPIFEVVAPPNVTLSETGTLQPGNYTVSVDLRAATFGSDGVPFPNSANCSANFEFSLGPAPTPTPTPTVTVTPSSTATPTPGPTLVARALNLSTRLFVQGGENVGIAGFIITGSEQKQVLLRGIGQTLGEFGVPNPLADPVLELHDSTGALIIRNDNGCDPDPPPGQATCQEIIATGNAPSNPLESVILTMLEPGAYTVILSGNNNGAGAGLVEVYDLSQEAASKLSNLSTRALVGTGSDIVISGFILGSGTSDDTILVRGIGPSLAESGVTNVLMDPTVELRNSDGAIVAANDNWQTGPPVSAPPSDPLESAIEMPLSPGAYTALLSGVSGGVGVGLVEVYDRGKP